MVYLQVKIARSLFEHICGLMLQRHPHALFFRTRWGIHTFFMRFPIDVVILDKQNNVVKIEQSLSPNKIFLWNPRFDRVIELPKGTIQQKKIVVGTHIQLEEIIDSV